MMKSFSLLLVVLAALFGMSAAVAKSKADFMWDDLPQSAKNAATILGYNKEKWDGDVKGSYEDRPFEQLTDVEKRAAIYLNMDIFDSHFGNTWWDDLDDVTAKHAAALGWGKEQWDAGYSFEDLENGWYWDDMTDEQKEAARYFGYTKATWNEDEDVEFEIEYNGDRRNLR